MIPTIIFFAGVLSGVLGTLAIVSLPCKVPRAIVIGRDVTVPRAVCIPSSYRRSHPLRWPS